MRRSSNPVDLLSLGRGGKGRLYHSHHSAMDNGPVTDVLWEEHNDLITRSSTDNR